MFLDGGKARCDAEWMARTLQYVAAGLFGLMLALLVVSTFSYEAPQRTPAKLPCDSTVADWPYCVTTR